MRILSCFKVVRNLDEVFSEDWKKIPVDLTYASKIYGCFDESALELSLKIKDTNPSAFCTALTVGNSDERLCRNLLAVGFDKVVNIKTDLDYDNPYIVSEAIKNFVISEEPYGIIMTGSCASVSDNGMIPFLLSEKLNIPAISEVTKVDIGSDILTVDSNIHEGSVRQTATAPVILSISNVPNTYLRVATLKEKMASKSRKTEEIKLSFENYKYPQINHTHMIRVETKKVCKMINYNDDIASELISMIGNITEIGGRQ